MPRRGVDPTMLSGWRPFLERVSVALLLFTPEGIVLGWNEGAKRLFGWEEGEVSGKKWSFFVVGGGRETFGGKWQCVCRGEASDVLVAVRRGTGEEIWVKWHLFPVKDERGKVALILAFVHPVHALKASVGAEDFMRRFRELEAYHRILTVVLETTDLEARCHQVLREILAFLDVEVGGIFLVEGERVVLRVGQGISDGLRAHFHSFPLAHVPQWFKVGAVVHEALSQTGITPEFMKRDGLQAWAFFPLVVGDDWLGALFVASHRLEALGEEDLKTLRHLSRYLALAIHHALEHRRARERLCRLSALRKIDDAIARSLNLRDIVRLILQSVPKEMGADAIALSLLDETRTHFEVFAIRLPNDTIILGKAFDIADDLLHWLTGRKEPVLIYDVLCDPRIRIDPKFLREWRLASYLAVPLVVRDKVIGVLHLLTTTPKRFSDEDIDFFQTLAGQAAIAVENARLFSEAMERADALEQMLAAQLDIVASDPEKAGEVILQNLQRCTKAIRADFYAYEPSTQTLRLSASIGFPKDRFPAILKEPQSSVPLNKGAIGAVAVTRKPLYIPDTEDEPSWEGFTYDKGTPLRSAYLVPLTFGEHLFGVIALLDPSPYAFSAFQRSLVDLFAHYAGAALEAARLRAIERDHHRLLETIQSLVKEIAHVTDLRSCLLSIHRAVREGLGFDRVGIWLYDSQAHLLRGTFGTDRDGFIREEWDLTHPMVGIVEEALSRPDNFLFISDFQELFKSSPDAIMEGVREHLVVSLWAGEKLVGMIGVDNLLTQRPITERDIKALRLFASYAGIAIENARLWEETRKQAEKLATLNRIISLALQRLDPQSIVRVIIDGLERLLPQTVIALFLYDAATDRLCLEGVSESARPSLEKLGLRVGMLVPSDWLATIKRLRGGECVHIKDVRDFRSRASQSLEKVGLLSGIACPLIVADEFLGVLYAARQRPNAFTDADVQLLKNIADPIALVFYNHRLLHRLQAAYEDLRQAQELLVQQERLRALGEMASGIAHDINNALVPIVAYIELLEIHDDPQVQSYAEKLRMAVDDIVRIIDRLRSFYRPRAPQEELEPVNLNEAIKHVIELSRPRWYDQPQREGITMWIDLDLDETLPPIAGIAAEIREALTNILFNAVDAIVSKKEGKGTITIRTGRKDNWAFVEVQDTGIGMDEETRRRAVEPFFTTKGERGSGLGLAMVYGTMQRHEGHLEIESQPGKGTTVRLLFPFRTIERKVKAEELEVSVPPLKVLLIDDDPRVLTAIAGMLKSLGHKVVTAQDGLEGLRKFREAKGKGEPFEVVITDWGMPQMTGDQVTQEVKRLSPETFVVILTGWGREQKAIMADGILGKPVTLREMKELFATLWQRRGALMKSP